MKKTILLLFFIYFSSSLIAQNIVIENSYQGGATLGPLNIITNPYGGSLISTFDVNSRLVATQVTSGNPATGSNGTSSSSWFKVDLPGTSSNTAGYVIAGSTFSDAVCSANYLMVNTNTPQLNIRTSAPINGTLASHVTISGVNAVVFQNQYFAIKSMDPNTNWYEIYLDNVCSQKTGWVSGAYITFYNSGNNGLPTPTLSNTLSGLSSTFNWTLAFQPSGYTNTNFTLYKSLNGATTSSLNINNAPPDTYTDANLQPSSNYNYYLVANYGSCSTQSNNINFNTGGNLCNYSISSSSYTFPNSNANSNSFSIIAQNGCAWNATVTSGGSWLTCSSAGTGNGTCTYSVTNNPNTTSRTGNITIAGQTFTVT